MQVEAAPRAAKKRVFGIILLLPTLWRTLMEHFSTSLPCPAPITLQPPCQTRANEYDNTSCTNGYKNKTHLTDLERERQYWRKHT